MKFKLIASAALMALASQGIAAVSADEARQLGGTLTEWGALKAGNADGTIPAYTGGYTGRPADFKPGSGFWADPFKDDKPLFRIDSKNMAQYADKLSEGQKKLLRDNPNTYYMNVYPSRRSVTYPDAVIKATVRNATACKTKNDGLSLIPECAGGMPFPIAKNGMEMMWNNIVRYQGPGVQVTRSNKGWVIDSNGKRTQTTDQSTLYEVPYYQQDLPDRDTTLIMRTYSHTHSPARDAGRMTGLLDSIDPVDRPRRAWSYTPGQRRVKLSPEFSYDTPVASQGGVTLFDELFVFSGKMDRFDFRLTGKKEMFLHYNAYKAVTCTADKALMAHHVNPDCERWELHRTNVIEATIKPGMRHVYSKRVYYFDEDLSGAGLYDAFDQNGALYRSLFNGMFFAYDIKTPMALRVVIYDFNKRNWAYTNDTSDGGYVFQKGLPDREMSAEATVARETTR